jgi:flavodoxin
MTTAEKGSEIAKGGFRNEDDVIRKFNDWKRDGDAQDWLITMGYVIDEIEYVKAVKISREKTDVQVQIKISIKLKDAIDVQNLQVKLVSNTWGFNQIDKRWVNNYVELWDMPTVIISILKRYTGEIKPTVSNTHDKRRMLANEFSLEERQTILNWLCENRMLIVSDILKGRGRFAAEWMLVIQVLPESYKWVLKPMNYCINLFGGGEITITSRGNFRIGNITMQRKGGDGGRESANMLQFKINPLDLFL